MPSHRIEMRLMGTQEDLEIWLRLVQKMQDHQILEIIEESKPYPNRGDSKQFRVYLKVNLNYPDESCQPRNARRLR